MNEPAAYLSAPCFLLSMLMTAGLISGLFEGLKEITHAEHLAGPWHTVNSGEWVTIFACVMYHPVLYNWLGSVASLT